MYSIVASPMRAGRSVPVFCWGIPIAVVGPVAETMSPILICAAASSGTDARTAKARRTSTRGSLESSNRIGTKPKPDRLLGKLPGGVAGRPRPLEIVAAQPAGDVDDFSDEEKPGRAGRR